MTPQAEDETKASSGAADCACCAEPPRSAAEILQLEGKAFFDALLIGSDHVPAGDLWGLLDRCAREVRAIDADPKADHFDEGYECLRVVERVAKEASPDDPQRVLRTFEGIRPDGAFGRNLTELILDRRLVLAAAGLRPAVAPAPLPETTLPDAARRAPAEVRAAWQQHAGLKRLYRDFERSLSEAGSLSVQSQFSEFDRDVLDFVSGRTTPAEAERALGRYVWGSWCGTGASGFTVPQTKALLLTQIEQGRYAVAAGAALSLPVSIFGEPSIPAEVFEGVLPAAGFDWETLAAVSLVADSDRGLSIGARGSERAARLLLGIAPLPGPFGSPNEMAESPEYMGELAAMVAPSGRCNQSVQPRRELPERTRPSGVTKETERRILDLLAAHVEAGAGREEAHAAAALLQHLCKPESLPAFHAMLRSAYSVVQQRGYDALAAYGQAPSGFTPAPPVSFRLLSDGKPLANTSLGYAINWTDGGSLSGGVTTDSSGVAALERDRFVDPKQPIETVAFSRSLTEEAGGLRLERSLPPPKDLDVVTVVRLRSATQH